VRDVTMGEDASQVRTDAAPQVVAGLRNVTLALLRRSADDLGQTVVMVTHDAHAAAFADRVVVLADGRVVHDGAASSEDAVHDLMRAIA